MATKSDTDLVIVDVVETTHSLAEVLADSAAYPDAFYIGNGYIAKAGKRIILPGSGSTDEEGGGTIGSGIPITDGEWESLDDSDYTHNMILQDGVYCKCPEKLGVDHRVMVYITPTNDTTKLAEWWVEMDFDNDPPELFFSNPTNEDAIVRIAGSTLGEGTNVYHLWSSDGGNTIFGEVQWFSY